jgi:hypothetical protein
MICAEAQAARSASPLDPGVAAHLESCASCAAALEAEVRALGLGPSPGAPPPPSLRSAVESGLAAERGALAGLRARPRGQRLALFGFAVLAVSGAVLALTPRPDLGTYPYMRMGLAVGAFALLALLGVREALRPLHRPPAPRWLVAALSLSGVLGPLVFACLGAEAHPGLADVPLWRSVLGCFVPGAALGGAMVVLGRALARGPGRDGALLAAAAAGLATNLALTLHCPIDTPPHLILGHVSISVALLGAALLRRA